MASRDRDHHHQAKNGYRFHPTNRELIKYLIGFARDEPLPDTYQFMQLVNLYADKEPWQIFEVTTNNDGNNIRYFITPQKKKKVEYKRFSRIVGKGTWKPQGKGKEVFDDKGRVMGYVKSLKYTPGDKSISSSKNPNGEWLMTEYSLSDGYHNKVDIKKKDYVICKIKKKEKPHDHKKNDEDMIDTEKFINSVLHEENINNTEKNLIYLEGDEVGDHVLAMLECENNNDDVAGASHDVGNNHKDELEKMEYLEGDEMGDHILGLLEDIDIDTIDFQL